MTRCQNIILLLLCLSFIANGQTKENKKNTEWQISHLLQEKSKSMEINGNPQIISSPYGEAVFFDGIDDALFFDNLPLNDLDEFTVEMLFKPETNAPFEQRILHIGKNTEDRMLLEIRAVDSNWYFDGFVASGKNKKALIDTNLLHPLGQWYHVAFVVTANKLSTYVNGVLELQAETNFMPIRSGITSIGVRQNKVSWFKGSIFKIRISPKKIEPKEFMN